MVCDPDTKTFGFPDLIIREDYLNNFITNKHYILDTNNTNYNYYIIDIKYHTLDFKKDSINLIPNPSQQQYISQMYLYTKGLRHLIHLSVLKDTLINHKSYILGRSWDPYNNEKNTKSFGSIDFNLYMRVLEKVNKGLIWYKELKNKGSQWCPYSPHVYELYPNMKNDKDNNWRKTKQNMRVGLTNKKT